MALVLMPSAHGLISWAIWLLLYELKLVAWNPTVAEAHLAFAFVLGAYAAATLCFFRPFRALGDRVGVEARSWQSGEAPLYKWKYVFALHALGFLGIGIYVYDFASALGGLSRFAFALVNSSYVIRWEAERTASIGIQISYFGWIATALTIFELKRHALSRRWVVAALLQFGGNLLFIDRTRPIWILYVGFLLYTLGGAERKLIRRAAMLAGVSLALFVGVAQWTGKVHYGLPTDRTVLPVGLHGVYLYGTGGFAYFNHIIQHEYPSDGAFARSFYPLFRVTSSLGFTDAPPSQVNVFHRVPIATNVGTFLEPLYRDGGWMWLVIGVLIHSFGFNALAVPLLASARPLALFAWANLCFVTFIGFFTPKFNNLPMWLFNAMGIMSVAAAAVSARRGGGVGSGRSTSPSRHVEDVSPGQVFPVPNVDAG